MNVDDMIGRKFGCLTVIRRRKPTDGGYRKFGSLVMVDAMCDCGSKITVAARDIRSERVLKCNHCQLVPMRGRMILSEKERMALASAAEARRTAKDDEVQKILARKRAAAEKRMQRNSQENEKKTRRIEKLRNQLAIARGIKTNTGDGDEK